jgi:hypothetical protein
MIFYGAACGFAEFVIRLVVGSLDSDLPFVLIIKFYLRLN